MRSGDVGDLLGASGSFWELLGASGRLGMPVCAGRFRDSPGISGSRLSGLFPSAMIFPWVTDFPGGKVPNNIPAWEPQVPGRSSQQLFPAAFPAASPVGLASQIWGIRDPRPPRPPRPRRGIEGNSPESPRILQDPPESSRILQNPPESPRIPHNLPDATMGFDSERPRLFRPQRGVESRGRWLWSGFGAYNPSEIQQCRGVKIW